MACVRGTQLNILFVLLLAVFFTSKSGHASGPARIASIGENCDKTNLCVASAKCDGGTCKCIDNYVPSSDLRACFEVTDDWEGPCSETAQCKKFEGALCTGSSCQCLPNHHYLDAKCWTTRHLKEECTHDKECTLLLHEDRIECSNHVCNCKEDFWINDIGDDCNGGNKLWNLGLVSLLLFHAMKQLLV